MNVLQQNMEALGKTGLDQQNYISNTKIYTI